MKKLLMLLSTGVILIGGAVCLSACSGGTEYSVTCQNSENGYVIVADTSVKAGEKVILAAHPSAGYKLGAFLLDGEAIEGVSFVMPEKDVTVSARFELITYSVTYVLGDMTVSEGNPSTYTVESAAELIAPQKEGYEVCGWYTYYTEPENEWKTINVEDFRVTTLEGRYGNLTLYAKYYNAPHEVTADYDENGWGYVDVYEACYGDTVSVTIDPQMGYELDYITVNNEIIEGTSFSMPAGDAKVYIAFKPIRYEITYVLNGGVNSPDNPAYYTVKDGDEDDFISFSEAVKEGYTFYGWCYDEECTQFVYGFSVYECRAITLYAYFEEDIWEE